MKKIRVFCRTCGIIEVEPSFFSSGEDDIYVPVAAVSKNGYKRLYRKNYGEDDFEDLEVSLVPLNHSEDSNREHDIGKYHCWSMNPISAFQPFPKP